MNKSKVEKISFYSNILGKEMPMLVHLPECYNSLTPASFRVNT